MLRRRVGLGGTVSNAESAFDPNLPGPKRVDHPVSFGRPKFPMCAGPEFDPRENDLVLF